MTTYRDDAMALQLRAARLELELAHANDEIARLRGGAPSSEASARTVERSWVTGAPVGFRDGLLVPFEIDDRAMVEIAAVLHGRLGLQVSRAGETLCCPDAFWLKRDAGVTRARLTATFRAETKRVVGGATIAAALACVPALGTVGLCLRLLVRRRIALAIAELRGALAAIATITAESWTRSAGRSGC